MTEEIVYIPTALGNSMRIELTVAGQGISLVSTVPNDAFDQAIDDWRKLPGNGFFGPEFHSVAERLGTALLPSEICDAIQSAARRALGGGHSVRLVFDFDDLSFAEVPWEIIRVRRLTPIDPFDGFLCLQPRLHLVRKSNRRQSEPRPRNEDLRALLVVADPGTARYPRLSWLDTEIRAVNAALSRVGVERTAIRSLYDATPAALDRSLREFRPHIVHFAGHGDLRPTGGVIILQGAAPGTESVMGEDLLGASLRAAGTRLLVLSACKTAGHPHALAEMLSVNGPVNVIAMQSAIGDAYQPQFARTLYGALVDGASIEYATTEARQSLAGTAGAWAGPVLLSSEPEYILIPRRFSDRTEQFDGNLPSAKTPLVGRVAELSSILRYFESDLLLTLTGPGGIGKTRLALEAGRILQSKFPDGVWYVECDACNDANDLFATIARTLHLGSGGRSVTEAVLDFLTNRSALLILDCCENLIAADAGRSIVSIVEAPCCCLVTSRIRPDLAGETSLEIQPFAPEGARDDLFVAAAGIDSARLSIEDREIIADIGQFLEGVPLAIVLAAARLRVLALPQLRTLLAASPLRTIDGSSSPISIGIQRSLALVPESDRILLWKLTIFAGSFTWEDVLAVYEENRFDLLDSLARLTDGSLLQPVEVGGLKRFRIFDTVREYVALRPQAEANSFARLEAQHHHASRFCSVAESIASLLSEGRWEEGAGLFWPNLGNFRAAFAFIVEHQRHKQVAKLVDSLARTLMETGLWAEFEAYLAEGYRAAEAIGDSRLTGRLLGLEGAKAYRQGDPRRGEIAWSRRAEVCVAAGDSIGASDATVDLAVQAIQDGNLERGMDLLDAAERLLADDPKPELLATIAVIRGRTLARRGQVQEAQVWASKAADLAAQADEHEPLLYVNTNLARTWSACGQAALAEQAYLKVIKAGAVGGRRTHSAVAAVELSRCYEQSGFIELAYLCAMVADRLLTSASPQLKREMTQRLAELAASYGSSYAIDATRFADSSVDLLIEEILRRSQTESSASLV